MIMKKMFGKIKITFLIIAVTGLSFIGCDGGKRMSRATEREIKNSPALQELDKVCRKLPFFEKIDPVRQMTSKKDDTLFYYYRLKKDFDELKRFYKAKLPPDGWTLVKEDSEIWEDQIEFKKGRYRIQISNGSFGDENYATSCEDSSIAD
jgi:hypothetical protein